MINVRVTQSQCSTPSYIRMHSGPSATPMNCDWCCLKTKNKAFCAPSIIPITTHNLIDITITAVTDMRYAWNSRSDNRQQKLAIWTMFERVQMDIILMFRQRIHRRPTNTNNKWKKNNTLMAIYETINLLRVVCWMNSSAMASLDQESQLSARYDVCMWWIHRHTDSDNIEMKYRKSLEGSRNGCGAIRIGCRMTNEYDYYRLRTSEKNECMEAQVSSSYLCFFFLF